MGWQFFFSDSNATDADSGYPKRMLRRLLFDAGLTIGSRVLVVGCTSPPFLRMLDGLGIDVVGLDDREDVLATAARQLPHVDLLRIPDTGPLPFPGFSFDLVVVAGCRAYADGFDTRRALRLTAELASLLRPAGRLSFLESAPSSNRRAAIEEHLESLPGGVASEKFGVAFSAETVEVSTLRIPSTPADRQQWRSLADAASDVRQVPLPPDTPAAPTPPERVDRPAA